MKKIAVVATEKEYADFLRDDMGRYLSRYATFVSYSVSEIEDMEETVSYTHLIKSLSVGQYGPKRCVDRILDKLDQYGVKATFYVPGLTAERYPEVIKLSLIHI